MDSQQPKTLDLVNSTISNYKQNIGSLNDIITQEQNRLNQKKQTVDSAIYTQDRIIQYNTSYQKRYNAYVYIICVLVIGLVIIFVSFLLQRIVPFFPATFILFITVIVLVFLIGYKLNDIYSRENVDYDLYNLNPPTGASENAGSIISTPLDASGNIIGAGCTNESCCAKGTQWDSVSTTCLPMMLASISTESKKDSFTTMSLVKPNDAFEYANYSRF